MTKGQIKAWILHFQNRIILQDNPVPLHHYLLNLLFKIYNDASCITDACTIVEYLNCNLPKLIFTYNKAQPFNVLEVKVTEPCENVFDVQVNISTSLNSFVPYTLLNNPEFFTFKNDSSYYFNIGKYIELNPSLFPSYIYISSLIKQTLTSPFTINLNNIQIGYYNEY